MRKLISLISSVLFLISFYSGPLFAQITAGNGTNIEYLDVSLNHDAAIVRLNPPNAHGISVNYVSTFNINENFQVLNASQVDAQGNTTDPAELIVFVANDVSITNDLELVGVPADLLILSSGDDFECINCTIKGFKKVVFANADAPDLSANTSAIGDLTSTASSLISLNNVQVSGANSFTVMAYAISTAGTINTNDTASKTSDGQFVSDPNGSYDLGVAELQLLIGPQTWNHEQSLLTSVNVNDQSCYAKNSTTNRCYSPYVIDSNTLRGKLVSAAVKITAASELTLEATVDTRNDALVFTAYAGGVMTLEEGLTLQTLANGKAKINASIYSDGVVRLRSTDDLELLSSAKTIQSQTIELFSGDQLTNRFKLEAENITMASVGELLNEGKVQATDELIVSADYGLSNQYGGLMSADKIVMNSIGGVVRNGSRTPYISSISDRAGFLNLQGASLNEFPLSTADISLTGADYMYSEGFTRAGTFYTLGNDVSTTDNKSSAADNSAHIVAGELEILALAVENINPYYEISDGASEIEFNSEFLRQVSILAERSLKIDASLYLVNSSAEIKLNSNTGKNTDIFAIDTAQFNNERYRGVSRLNFQDEKYISSTGEEDIGYGILRTTTTSAEDFFYTETLVTSPPGTILSMGLFKLDAEHGFLNKMGYFEVFNDADINSPAIRDIGLIQEGRGTIVTTLSHRSINEYCDTSSSIYCPSDEPSTYSNGSSLVLNTELDSLFYVEGDLLASQSVIHLDDYSSLDGFIQQAIFDLIGDEYSHLGSSKKDFYTVDPTDEYPSNAFGGKTWWLDEYIGDSERFTLGSNDSVYDSIQDIKTSGSIQIDWSETYRTGAADPNYIDPNRSFVDLDDTYVTANRGSDEFSLVEVLTSFWEKIKDTWSEVYDEFKWWD